MGDLSVLMFTGWVAGLELAYSWNKQGSLGWQCEEGFFAPYCYYCGEKRRSWFLGVLGQIQEVRCYPPYEIIILTGEPNIIIHARCFHIIITHKHDFTSSFLSPPFIAVVTDHKPSHRLICWSDLLHIFTISCWLSAEPALLFRILVDISLQLIVEPSLTFLCNCCKSLVSNALQFLPDVSLLHE